MEALLQEMKALLAKYKDVQPTEAIIRTIIADLEGINRP